MKRFVILACLPLLAGCDIDAKNPADGDHKVAINANADGKVAFDMPFASGEMTLPAGMMSEGNIDLDGVKLMPGSTITGFAVAADEGQDSKVNIGFSAPRPPAEVRSYFAGEFARNGAEATADGKTVRATTSEGNDVVIAVEPAGTGSKGMIMITSKG